jgi:guanine deaminase
MEDRHMTERLILGQVLRLDADPAQTGPEAAAATRRTGAHARQRRSRSWRSATPSPPRRPSGRCPSTTTGDHLILPGFIDAHAHYPQTAIIASWGKRLIDWLNTYTFPEEMRFADPAYARDREPLSRPPARPRHDDGLQLLHHPSESVDALFTAARGARHAASRGQDLHGPRHRTRRPARHRAIRL